MSKQQLGIYAGAGGIVLVGMLLIKGIGFIINRAAVVVFGGGF